MKKKVLFIGRFPPPVHGAAVMNENYFNSQIINKTFELRRVKINSFDKLDELGKVSFQKFFYTLNSYFKLTRELIFFRPNLIYFELAPKGIAFFRDSLYVLLCKAFKKKIIFQLHAKGISKASQNKMLRAYYSFILKNAQVILPSKYIYSDVSEVINKKNAVIVPNAVIDQIGKEDFGKIMKDRNKIKIPSFLFLSNMIETKGPIDVLKICNELNKKKIKFICNFVGDLKEKGFQDKFFKVLQEYELQKKCKYLGAKYGSEKKDIMKKATHFILPTTYPEETNPAVILEAFSFGIPVFSYNNGGIKEMVSETYLGHVSDKSDWLELKRKIEESLMKRPESKKIRKHYKENYTFEKAEKRLIALINKKLS